MYAQGQGSGSTVAIAGADERPGPDGRILLNSGPSPRGWHRIESILRCLQLYAYHAILQLNFGVREPLTKGSLGHAGLAHVYAREQAVQLKRSPDAYHTPAEALVRTARTIGPQGEEWRPLSEKAIAAYQDFYATDKFKVLEVEQVHSARIGAELGRVGHDGQPGYLFTQRFDLVVEDRNGRVWVWDHKFVGSIDKRKLLRYSLSGQFLGLERFGRATWGERFGGVKVNLVEWGTDRDKPEFKFDRVAPKPAPNMLARFTQIIIDAEDRAAAVARRDPWDYPKAASEQVCVGPYGQCDAYLLCQWGPRGLEMKDDL